MYAMDVLDYFQLRAILDAHLPGDRFFFFVHQEKSRPERRLASMTLGRRHALTEIPSLDPNQRTTRGRNGEFAETRSIAMILIRYRMNSIPIKSTD